MKLVGLTLLVATLFVVGCESSQPTATSPIKSEPNTAAATVTPPQSNWQVDTATNPVTGELTTTAYLKDQGSQNIYIRQKGKKLDFYINTGDFLETMDNLDSRATAVQYRFDSGKVTRQTWTISDDNEAIFYPGNPKGFLTQMRQAKNFAIEYKPAEKIPETITLDVTGLPDVFLK